MLVYFITRFSIFDPASKAFKLTRENDTEYYKSYLFSKERLEYKFSSFEKITLPSIVQQTNNNYIWEIYTSNYLPTEYKERLLESTKSYENIKIYFVESFKEFNKSKKINDKYCTVRLDDDDGLNENYVEIMQKYKDETNAVISFPNGKYITIQNNEIIYGSNILYKLNAQGLCSIGQNIYGRGSHTSLDKMHKVIYDMTPDMYLFNCSKFCDTKRIFK